jgi:hypothetical protein
MRKSEANEIVTMLLAAYPHFTPSEQTPAVYELMMQDLDYSQTKAAVTRIICTSKFFPSIAEIREACLVVTDGSIRTGGDAWAEVKAAVRKFGRSYGPDDPLPVFDDTILVRAMRMWGSWNSLCNAPEDDPGGRARFIEFYDSLARDKRRETVSRPAFGAAAAKALPSGSPVDLARLGGAVRAIR